MITGNVDGEISIEVDEFLLGNKALWSDGYQIEELLEYGVFGLMPQFELFEVGGVELLTFIVGKLLRAM